MEQERKSKTLFVRNLPFTAKNDDLEKLFSAVGPLKQCFVVKNKDEEKCKGYGYVSFSLIEDAEKAKTEVKSLNGRKLFITYANKKKDTKLKKSLSQPEDLPQVKTEPPDELDVAHKHLDHIKTEDGVDLSLVKKEPKTEKSEDVKKDDMKYLKAKTLVVTEFPDPNQVQTTLDKLNIKNISKTEFPVKGRDQLTAFIRFKSVRDLKKGQKKLDSKGLHAVQLSKENKIVPQKVLKQAKLIIRNLSFHCSEKHLEEVFSPFGEISEVKIPKQPNGRMFGFGFVQFTTVESAEKALKSMNSKMIRGRPVAVDWAVPKHKFEKENKMESEEEDNSSEEEDESDQDVDMSDESEEESSDEEDVPESESDSSKHSDDSDDSDEESSDEGFHESSPLEKKKEIPVDNSVEDGRTLFIRNLSYETEEDTLTEIMSEFGPTNYCRIVIDPKMQHSRGIGFVRFKKIEDAESCLKKADDQGPGVIIDGRKLLIAKAVSRQKATEMKKKEKTKDDKRNVHLAREGLIRAGTKDAIGLSKEDLAKRNKTENVKRQRLKNPNIFVSTTRLCIHNLPTSVDEKELKQICLKAAGGKPRITECRVMRDTARVNAKGVAKSRGYAFVNFTEHERALQCLRNTNNNPDLFKDHKRLIVEFSLENKNALLAKEKRLERFQARKKQLDYKKSGGNNDKKESNDNTENESRKNNKNKQKTKITERYIGNVKLPKGKSLKNVLPTHTGPKIRHKARPQNKPSAPKPEKRRPQMEQQSPLKQKKRKKNKERVDDFDKLVNSYKQKIMTSKSSSKWFEN